MPSDIEVVDSYLAQWDEFARGAKALAPALNEGRPAFEAALTRLLSAGDPRAPARLVFSAVVQVGGAIPADSGLGRTAAVALGSEVPVTTTKEGRRVLFAGHLFAWWERNRDGYERFPLFDEWAGRDFAKRAVIPMYRRLASEGNA